MSNLKQYLPKMYEGVLETNILMQTEDTLFSELMQEYLAGENNQYILTADEYGIKIFEDIINIVADPETETLEFRRDRLLNRFATQPPYTFKWLQKKLDQMIGVGAWNAWVDNNAYTLYIESSASNQKWYQEIAITINRIKPANIVFINRPTIYSDVAVNEQVNLRTLDWNYKLGTIWQLGQKPFISYQDKGVIVLATTPSIQQELLNRLANFTAADIKKVRVNGTYLITDFEVKSATTNTVTVQYYVMPESGITHINRIELLNENSEVLTDSAVYVPLVEGVNMKHTILVKEG